MRKIASNAKAKAVKGRPTKTLTSEDKRRWERAVADELNDENYAAARRGKRSTDAGISMLRDAARLLRAERERQSLTAAEVAERCDMERSVLCRLETADDANPTVATLCALAEALGKSIEIRLRDARE